MRKPRPQGPLNTLSPEKRDVLHGWLAENLLYPEILARLKSELGVSTSLTAIGNYYQKWGTERLAERVAIGAAGVEIKIAFEAPNQVAMKVRPLPDASSLAGGGK
jgi:hypothetical protein